MTHGTNFGPNPAQVGLASRDSLATCHDLQEQREEPDGRISAQPKNSFWLTILSPPCFGLQWSLCTVRFVNPWQWNLPLTVHQTQTPPWLTVESMVVKTPAKKQSGDHWQPSWMETIVTISVDNTGIGQRNDCILLLARGARVDKSSGTASGGSK